MLLLWLGFLLGTAHAGTAAATSQCPKLVSTVIKRQLNQSTTWNMKGTCDANLKAERERQSTQAQLACLMGGWESVTDFRISCKRYMAFSKGKKLPALHYDYSWRCTKLQCK